MEFNLPLQWLIIIGLLREKNSVERLRDICFILKNDGSTFMKKKKTTIDSERVKKSLIVKNAVVKVLAENSKPKTLSNLNLYFVTKLIRWKKKRKKNIKQSKKNNFV